MKLLASNRLEELVKLVAWLDSARWSKENQTSFSWQPDFQLSSSQEMLVHWLTYITDIQRPWQHVWNVGRPVFREIVKSFSVANFQTSKGIKVTKLGIQHFLNDFRTDPESKKVRTFRYGELEYTPRYPNQHDFIERVLTILAYQYGRDFIRFMGESIRRWEQSPEGLRRVAHDLYLLTYSPLDLDKTVDLLIDKDQQEVAYSDWNRFGYKRLWAALRDYRKMRSYLKLVKQGFGEAFGQKEGSSLYTIWTRKTSFGPELLELPGDVWNNDFMERVVKPLADNSGLLIKKSWGASRMAREIYDQMGTRLFYPEQLDVSFDLSAKACENGDCDLCPFGDSELKEVCLSHTSAVGDKYCPIALATCQYRIFCNPENCPVVNQKKKGLCTQSS